MKITCAKNLLMTTFFFSFAFVFSVINFKDSLQMVTSNRAVLFQAEPSPTPDRLAEPTLPVETSQADLGAQDFWLHCLPCHGDRGQGLTDEFRLLYPVEEQNCWESGCHGNRPYENGWRLPEFVPAILGDQLLSQFKTAGGLFNFIQSAMPYQNPGSLNDVTYFQLVSFLTRENGLLAPNVTIDSNNASSIFFQGIGQITPAVTAILQLPSGTAVAPTIQEAENARNTEQNNSTLYILFGLLMLTILVLGLRAVLL